jgi:hypothetical protein
VLLFGGPTACAIGVVTSACIDGEQGETGATLASSPESLLNTLHENGLYPAPNRLAVKAFASELSLAEEQQFFQTP